MLSVCLSTFSSVVHFRCRMHFRAQALRGGKVFGLNTLRRRKILPKTACRPTFQLSMAIVLPSQISRGKERLTKSGNS